MGFDLALTGLINQCHHPFLNAKLSKVVVGHIDLGINEGGSNGVNEMGHGITDLSSLVSFYYRMALSLVHPLVAIVAMVIGRYVDSVRNSPGYFVYTGSC